MNSHSSIRQLMRLNLAVGLLGGLLGPGPGATGEPGPVADLHHRQRRPERQQRDCLAEGPGRRAVAQHRRRRDEQLLEGAWQTFSVESGSLGHNIVTVLLEDRAGWLWVGTSGGGVSRYLEDTWQTFSTRTGSLGSNRVTALLKATFPEQQLS